MEKRKKAGLINNDGNESCHYIWSNIEAIRYIEKFEKNEIKPWIKRMPTSSVMHFLYGELNMGKISEIINTECFLF